MLPLDCGQEFDANRDADFFAALPERPGVLLIEMKAPNAKPYLARTADIRRAAERLLRVPEALSKRLNLREVAARVRYRVTGSKFEQTLTLYELAREYFPQRYRALLRLRPPAVLKINLRNEYPRCYVTRSIRADGGFYLGPFASRRVAEAFAQGFLDLFKIRRCQIKIRRDPTFPGCIYSEMKMCLAPCFAGCTKEDYDVEVARVVEALASAGESLTDQLQREREAASEALDFERASALHKRIEKVSGHLRGMPEIARRIDDLNAVILQRAAEEKTVIVFPVLAGLLREPVLLRFAELASEPRSVEAILRAALESKPAATEPRQAEPNANPDSAMGPEPVNVPKQVRRKEYGLRAAPPELPEHLSLVARWFYSKPRDGEVFFRESDWPYRRILRACSRLLAPPEAQAPASPPPPPSK
ncbi:MAG TPA: UvrB/UvrC motif-containing protein [Candidatus Acidoferrales bacterium]|nr:UvrB/UvrC motif-containing protein [Candidatus Acidoferrales bacterium]